MDNLKELTQAEEQVMKVLWDLKQAYVKDILDHFEEPKPAYTTVSTIIRILETKGFVSHESFGKTYRYFPLVQKSDYTQMFMKKFVGNYFGQSFHKMVSFFASADKLSIQELEAIKHLMESEIDKKKNNVK